MFLTDQEQKQLLDELSPSTKTKILAVLSDVDRRLQDIPAPILAAVERARQENCQLHKQSQDKIGLFMKKLRNSFAGAVGEFDK